MSCGLGKNQRSTHAYSQLCVPLWTGTDPPLRWWKWAYRLRVAHAAAFQVESIIHDRQRESITMPSMPPMKRESTVFIEFMLSAIKVSLIGVIHTSDEMSDGTMDKTTFRWKKIKEYLKTHNYIMMPMCGNCARCRRRQQIGFLRNCSKKLNLLDII